MPASTEDQYADRSNPLPSQISNTVVRLLRDYTGRGPTKARTTIRDNVVLVILEQALTKGERSLADRGRGEKVLDIRHEYQEAMRQESSDAIAQLTGRSVVAMLSANHIDPDLAAEIYILDQPPDYNARTWEAAAEVADADGQPGS